MTLQCKVMVHRVCHENFAAGRLVSLQVSLEHPIGNKRVQLTVVAKWVVRLVREPHELLQLSGTLRPGRCDRGVHQKGGSVGKVCVADAKGLVKCDPAASLGAPSRLATKPLL